MHVDSLHPAEEQERYRRLFETHFEQQPAVISQFDGGSPVFAVTADGERLSVEINAWVIEDTDYDQPIAAVESRELGNSTNESPQSFTWYD